MKENAKYASFYGERRSNCYGDAFTECPTEKLAGYNSLKSFIADHGLQGGAKCLEIGSSGGGFQDMVTDYYGTDIAASLSKYYHKPYRVCEKGKFPFDDGMFDAIWTINTYEHIPELESAMLEIVRLLRPGGVLLFQPAWQCRPWAADGYPVRPYSDFGLVGKMIKLSIPFRNSVLWRASLVMPKRLFRTISYRCGIRSSKIRYNKLVPNYEHYWMSDSDACNSIDPHDAILWFMSQGFECLSHPSLLKAFLARSGATVFRKRDSDTLSGST